MIILDEGDAIGKSSFEKYVLPIIISSSQRVLVATTTPGNRNTSIGDSVFGALQKVKDEKTGELIFRTLNITGICSECAKNKNFQQCFHQKGSGPSWRSVDKLNLGQQLYHALDGDDVFLTEIGGCVDSYQSTNALYSKEKLDKMSKRIPYQNTATKKWFQPKVLYLMIDPSGGGSSRYGVLAGYFSPDVVFHVSLSNLISNPG